MSRTYESLRRLENDLRHVSAGGGRAGREDGRERRLNERHGAAFAEAFLALGLLPLAGAPLNWDNKW